MKISQKSLIALLLAGVIKAQVVAPTTECTDTDLTQEDCFRLVSYQDGSTRFYEFKYWVDLNADNKQKFNANIKFTSRYAINDSGTTTSPRDILKLCLRFQNESNEVD